MHRRTLLATVLGGSVIGRWRLRPAVSEALAPPRDAVTRLAGLPLDSLRDAWRHELFDDVLPLLRDRVVDDQYGGFICVLNPDGTHADTAKDTSFQGRGIWVYSYLYTHFGRDPAYLAVARRAVDLLLNAMPPGDAPWPSRLSREGRPIAPPPQTIAADVAIAEGLAAFAVATGERRYRELALQVLLRSQRTYDRPDYAPDVVTVYHGPEPMPFPGARSQGAAMILIGAGSPMLATESDPRLAAVVGDAVDAVMQRHYDPGYRLNTELLNHDYSRPANRLAQFVYTGHCLEVLGIILQHAVRTGDRPLFTSASERLRRHAVVAWDDVYGGFFRSLNNVEANEWALNKLLWVQEEVLTALLIVIEHTGAAWAQQLFDRTLAYVQSAFYVSRWGTRFWISGGDRQVTREPNLARVEHYHHPRRLMLGILTLERMLASGGRAKLPPAGSTAP